MASGTLPSHGRPCGIEPSLAASTQLRKAAAKSIARIAEARTDSGKRSRGRVNSRRAWRADDKHAPVAKKWTDPKKSLDTGPKIDRAVLCGMAGRTPRGA
jgi:hypothetical protein